MTDLLIMLRAAAHDEQISTGALYRDAADEIERLSIYAAADFSSLRMFIARLENLKEHGRDRVLIDDVLTLLNACNMLASREREAAMRARLGERHE